MSKAKWTYPKVREALGKSPANFTFYETFANAIAAIPNKTARAMLTLAIHEYGSYGIEPKFTDIPMKDGGSFPAVALQAIFESFRINIENSVVSHYVGSLGGRKSKAERALDAKESSAPATDIPQEVIDELESSVSGEIVTVEAFDDSPLF